MSGRAILWTSAIILLAGAVALSVIPVAPSGGEETYPWMIPVAYFTMIIGAVGLCWGWFRKQQP